MKRRDFVKVGLAGMSAVVVGSMEIPPLFRCVARAANLAFDMSFTEALVEMIDKTQVYHWLFSADAGFATTGPSLPGPTIIATYGDKITINFTNNLPQPHGFRIVGTSIGTGVIPNVNKAPANKFTLTFTAPPPGTYLYIDPFYEPVNRILGLHGAFISLPKGGNTPYGGKTTPNVQQLFNDLGSTPQFPGDPWLPPPANRSLIWLFHQVDPWFNARAQAGIFINPDTLKAKFLPRYFLISGKTGAFASDVPNISIVGNIGEPHLIRILNAGLANHSPHLHANHFYVLSKNLVVQNNVLNIDTFTVGPLDTVDWLVPMIRPPDIPGLKSTPLRQLIPHELTTVLYTLQSPLMYPMHCHMEMSQTAAGGNYPQGLITHMIFTGDVDKVPFPV